MDDRPDPSPGLTAAADELYALPPQDFTARRRVLAATATRDGDRALATAIGALRRPTVSAWLLNLLARTDPAPLNALLAVGERLRAAQTSLDGPGLQTVGAQRQHAERGALAAVRRLAESHGQRLTATVEQEVAQTLRAVTADPRAGAAVASGTLTKALSYAGFGGPGAAVTALPVGPRAVPSAPVAVPGDVPDELAARRARRGTTTTAPEEAPALRDGHRPGRRSTTPTRRPDPVPDRDGARVRREAERARRAEERARRVAEQARDQAEQARREEAARLRHEQAARARRDDAARDDAARDDAARAEADARTALDAATAELAAARARVDDLHAALQRARAAVAAATKRVETARRTHDRAARAHARHLRSSGPAPPP